MTFERAFVISLTFRDDRLNNFFRQAKSLTSLPEIEVWPAVHGDTCPHPETWSAGSGAWGCYKSHLNILEYCLNNGVSSYIVFEDDSQFRPKFDENLRAFLSEVPCEWEQIYLGGQLQKENIHPPVRVSSSVFRPFNVNRTHCFAVSRSGMVPMYRHICSLPFADEEHIDHHLGRWHEHPQTEVYCPPRWLVGQMGFSSNVSGRIEAIEFYNDPIDCELKHWLLERPVCIYYRGSPTLLKHCRGLLHQGNQLDSRGYDITLSNAHRLIDPSPEIFRWYNWIRTEIIQSNSQALPCFYHPFVSPSQVESALKCPVIVTDAQSVTEIRQLVTETTKNHAQT